MNLNELHVPAEADDAMQWAARIELDLRADSYAQAKLWGIVGSKIPTQSFECNDPEGAWVLDQMLHSIHVDLLEGK